jgi:hypothetical protein
MVTGKIIKMILTGKGLYDEEEATVCRKDHCHYYLRMSEPCDCGKGNDAKAK